MPFPFLHQTARTHSHPSKSRSHRARGIPTDQALDDAVLRGFCRFAVGGRSGIGARMPHHIWRDRQTACNRKRLELSGTRQSQWGVFAPLANEEWIDRWVMHH